MKTRSTTMREMSLDGITAKVKVKAAAAAKKFVRCVPAAGSRMRM